MSAGITADPRGTPRNSTAICRWGQYGAGHDDGLIARLTAMGVVPELVLSNGFYCDDPADPQGGTCTQRYDVADYRAFWANGTANIAEMVRIGEEWGTRGWHFDLEPRLDDLDALVERARALRTEIQPIQDMPTVTLDRNGHLEGEQAAPRAEESDSN